MRNQDLELLIPPPLLLLATALLMWIFAVFLTFAKIDIPARTIIGTTAFTLGVLIDVCAVIQFWRAKTTVNPISVHNTTRLVTTGLYRFSRNPMYIGQLLILIAWAIYLRNVLSMFWIPAYIFWIERFQIVPEERLLEAKFRGTFIAYARRVRRWV